MVNFASMQGLSILIPVYKDSCVAQALALRRQCQGLEVQWEIVVADDGSPSPYDALNDEISSIGGCRLVKRRENVGRAAIRNFLAREARFDTLLYIDAGMMPSEGFIDAYARNMGQADVVVGSLKVAKGSVDLSSLRCRNEMKAERGYSVSKSNERPYANFHSGNFMAERHVVTDNPFALRQRLGRQQRKRLAHRQPIVVREVREQRAFSGKDRRGHAHALRLQERAGRLFRPTPPCGPPATPSSIVDNSVDNSVDKRCGKAQAYGRQSQPLSV